MTLNADGPKWVNRVKRLLSVSAAKLAYLFTARRKAPRVGGLLNHIIGIGMQIVVIW